jgi:hypothetical protein
VRIPLAGTNEELRGGRLWGFVDRFAAHPHSHGGTISLRKQRVSWCEERWPGAGP